MNQKELNEIRRRMAPNKSNISKIYGCYVNSSKEIVSYLDESLGIMPDLDMREALAKVFLSMIAGQPPSTSTSLL